MGPVTFEVVQGGVCLIKLDDGKVNSFSPAFIGDFHTALDHAEQNPDCKAVVVSRTLCVRLHWSSALCTDRSTCR